MKLSVDFGNGTAASESTDALPLRLLVLADLGASGASARELCEMREKADFDAAFECLAPRVLLSVVNKLAAHSATPETATAPTPLAVDLKLTSLRDFAPESVVRAQPVLWRVASLIRKVAELPAGQAGEQAIAELAASNADLPAVQAALMATAVADAAGTATAPTSTAQQDTEPGRDAKPEVDLFAIAQATSEQPSEQRAKSGIGSLISSIGRSRSANPARGGRKDVEQRLTELLFAQLDQIYHHPDWQRVEANWRGLWLLVKGTDFRAGVRILVGHADRASVTSRLVSLLDDQRVSVALCPQAFDDIAKDDAALEELASLGERKQVVIVSSVAMGFLGLASAKAAAELDSTSDLLAGEPYKNWRALQEKDCARWLSVTFNRVLLRDPWGQQRRRDPVEYREVIRDNIDYLWGDSVFVVGSLIAQSFAATGWATEIIGRSWRVDDLAVRPWKRTSGREIQLALESRLPTQLVDALARSGILSPVSMDNTDTAELIKAPTVAGIMLEGRPALPYQLAASRFVEAIEGYLAKAGPDGLQTFLTRFVEETGAGAFAQVRRSADALEVEVGTGRGVLRGVRFGFSFRA
jgi:predicted component of type VI protein secretion system